MSNITQLKREALAAKLTGWQGEPIAPQQTTAADLCALIRTAAITERQAIDVVRALSCRLHALGCDDDVIALLDQCSDDMTGPCARMERAQEEADALRQGEEDRQHERDIEGSWA